MGHHKGRRHPRLIIIILILIFLLACQDKEPTLKIGDAAPSFTLKNVKGELIRVPEGMKGKVLIMVFTASWCRSCYQELPIFEALYRQFKERGLEVIFIMVGDAKEVVEAYTAKFQITFRVLLDVDTAVAKLYGVVGFPTLLVIDRRGIVREKVLGSTEGKALEREILKYL